MQWLRKKRVSKQQRISKVFIVVDASKQAEEIWNNRMWLWTRSETHLQSQLRLTTRFTTGEGLCSILGAQKDGEFVFIYPSSGGHSQQVIWKQKTGKDQCDKSGVWPWKVKVHHFWPYLKTVLLYQILPDTWLPSPRICTSARSVTV